MAIKTDHYVGELQLGLGHLSGVPHVTEASEGLTAGIRRCLRQDLLLSRDSEMFYPSSLVLSRTDHQHGSNSYSFPSLMGPPRSPGFRGLLPSKSLELDLALEIMICFGEPHGLQADGIFVGSSSGLLRNSISLWKSCLVHLALLVDNQISGPWFVSKHS